jgi:hypothetical protein
MKIVLYFSAKVGIEDTFKRKIQKDSLRVSTVDRSKRELCYFQMFGKNKILPYLNIH